MKDLVLRCLDSKTFWVVAAGVAHAVLTKDYSEIPALLAILFARDTVAKNA